MVVRSRRWLGAAVAVTLGLVLGLCLVSLALPAAASPAASPAADPVIQDIQPREAYAKEWVTIAGANFGPAPGRVTFTGPNGRLGANTRDWSDTSIRVEVPYLTYPGDVIVQTSAGRTSNGFHFSQPCWDKPVIKSIVPSTAMQCEVVKITGCGFGDFQYEQKLTFNGADATGTVIGYWSDTELLVPVPDAATSGPVVVTNKRRVPSAGTPFKVLDDEPQWYRLPSIDQGKHEFYMELKVRTIPADPDTPSSIVTERWSHALGADSLPVHWLTQRDFEQRYEGPSRMGTDNRWEIDGHVDPDARALFVRYRDRGGGIISESPVDRVVCEYEGELTAVLPLVDTFLGWNVWAPRFTFAEDGPDLETLIFSVSYRRTCRREDRQGNFLRPEDSYVLENIDWTGSTSGLVLNTLALSFEGPGKDPCYGPKPTWEPKTDLIGQAYVPLLSQSWVPTTSSATRQALPGLPVRLLHTPPGARDPVELGRTVTDHEGWYRFFSLPITDSLQLELTLENGQTAPSAFQVTYARANGAAVAPVKLRTSSFATTTQRPSRHDTAVASGAGTSAVPDSSLADVAAIYAHTWQVWNAAAELALPLDWPAAIGRPLEIRAFSPEVKTFWSGEHMVGPQYGRLPSVGGDLLVNIEASDSALSDAERPVNREYHELGHHVMADLFDNAMPRYWISPAISDTNHSGQLNPSTTDSWIEGFAEYFATAVSRRVGDPPRPELYPLGSQTVLNLDHNYKARSHAGSPAYASWEEFAVASLLFDLADSRNDDYDLTPLGVTQSLLTAWQVQLTDPLAAPVWPPKTYGDRIQMGDRALLALIRDSQTKSQRHGLHAPNAPAGYDYLWDVNHLHDLLEAEGIGQGPGSNGLKALDELFVAHGFFADTAPQNLVYDPGEAVGMTSAKALTVISQTIPARVARYSPGPPPTGHLNYTGRDVDTGASVAIRSFTVALAFDPPYEHYSYEYLAPAGTDGHLALVPPEPLYPCRIRIMAHGPGYKSVTPFDLTGDEYWQRAPRAVDGEVASHTFDMRREPVYSYLPLAARGADLQRLPVPPTAQVTPPASADLEAGVVALINAERARAGLGQLAVVSQLKDAAKWYANDMAAYGYYNPDHSDRLGRTMAERLKAFGYTPDGFPRWQVAENIAQGQTSAAEVVADWLASPPHRANILDDGACEIGVGHARSAAADGEYWVSDFGCRSAPATEPAPTTPAVPPTSTSPTPSPTATRTVSPGTPGTPSTPATRTPSPTVTPPIAPPTSPIAPTATTTPSATLVPGHGIQGHVTTRGTAAEGLFLSLVHVVGDTHTEQYMAQTFEDGRYAFAAAADLGADERYYVKYTSEDDPAHVGVWFAPNITGYRAGQDVAGGDFDIAGVTLTTPGSSSTVSLPARFEWQRRDFGSFTYAWVLYDEASGRRWWSGDVGDTGTFTLSSLPDGVAYDQDYWWYVRVYAAPDSYGLSYFMNRVRFRAAPEPTPGWPAVFADDFCDDASGWPSGNTELVRYGYHLAPPCEYQIEHKTAQLALYVTPHEAANGDFAVEATGYPVGQGGFGVVFGATSGRDRYDLFRIDTNGRFCLLRYASGAWSTVIPLTEAAGIDPGFGNRLRVVSRGRELELWLDDALLTGFTDSQVHDGEVGVYAESFAAGFQGRFTAFRVEQAP